MTKAIQLQCDMISKIILIPCKNSTEIIRGKDVINPLGILQCSVWARVDELRGERWLSCGGDRLQLHSLVQSKDGLLKQHIELC